MPSSSIRFSRRLVLLALLAAAAIAAEPQRAAAAPRLETVRVETRGTTATIHVRTSAPTSYRVQLLDTPVRLVVDLDDTVFAWRQGPLDLTTPPLRQIRGSQFTKDVSRVVVEFARSMPYAVTNEHDGIRIDVGAATQAGPEVNSEQRRRESDAKARTDVEIRTSTAETTSKAHGAEQRTYAATQAAHGAPAHDRAIGYVRAMTLTLVVLTTSAVIASVRWRHSQRAEPFGESSRDRPVLKVTLRPGRRPHRREDGSTTLLHVKVANVGRQSTSITHVSLMLPRRCSHKYILCTDPRTATYPVELAERRTHSFVFNEDLLAVEFGLTSTRFVARVDDVAGRSYWSHGRAARVWKLGRFA